jgi:hypothetical protein
MSDDALPLHELRSRLDAVTFSWIEADEAECKRQAQRLLDEAPPSLFDEAAEKTAHACLYDVNSGRTWRTWARRGCRSGLPPTQTLMALAGMAMLGKENPRRGRSAGC